MQRAYGPEIPHRQFGGRTKVQFSLDKAQNGMLHPLLGISSGFGCYLRFRLGRETHFHASRLRSCRRRLAFPVHRRRKTFRRYIHSSINQ